jgi:RES domain-containing protein
VIDIPDAASIEWLDPQAVPGWDMPHCSQSRVFGDAWYDSRRSAVLVVPSVVCPHERNILINQAHPAFPAIRASEPLPLRWDARLFGGPPGG